jgi:hypothetical protein
MLITRLKIKAIRDGESPCIYSQNTFILFDFYSATESNLKNANMVFLLYTHLHSFYNVNLEYRRSSLN